MTKTAAKKILDAHCPGWKSADPPLLHYVKNNTRARHRIACIQAARIVGETPTRTPAPAPALAPARAPTPWVPMQVLIADLDKAKRVVHACTHETTKSRELMAADAKAAGT